MGAVCQAVSVFPEGILSGKFSEAALLEKELRGDIRRVENLRVGLLGSYKKTRHYGNVIVFIKSKIHYLETR